MSEATSHSKFIAPAARLTRSWRRIIAHAALPPPLSELVTTTVRRARLWPSERADVARELVAHFRDGLDRGLDPAALAADFGAPATAARLITRARQRGRGWWYQGWVWLQRGVLALLAVTFVGYVYLAARFYLAQPTVKRNYTAEWNKVSQATPESERAWPLYLQAIKLFGQMPKFDGDKTLPTSPTDEHWPIAAEFVRSRGQALALVREGAARPVLGVPYLSDVPPELVQALQTRQRFEHIPESHDDNPMLVGVLLPHLGEMRQFSRILAVDAREAMIAGDRERAISDIEAILGMSSQTWSEPFMISDLVALAQLAFACDLAREAAAAGILSQADLRHLAHALAVAPAPSLELDFSAETAQIDDFLQRFFTDDGSGDGHTVYSTMPVLHRQWGTPDPAAKLLVRAALPALSAQHVSRAQLRHLSHEAIAAAERDQRLPLWRRGERTCDVSRAKLDQAMGDIFPPLLSLMVDSATGKILISRDIAAMHREAALTVLALEAHRQAHGQYPATLAMLAPSFLPRVPIDAADGRPLRYRLQDGRPLLYSVGCDGDDDNGRPTPKPSDAARFAQVPTGPADHPPSLGRAAPAEIDGDWIFYPPMPR